MDSQALAALIDSASSLTVTRHFTLAGCVVLLWDHLLTFGDEIEYIWRLPVEFSKLVFLFNRYFVAGCLCCSVYVLLELRAPLSLEICHNYILFLSCTSIVALTIANLTVTLHIQSLWEKQTAATYILMIGFCITYGVTIVCAGLVAHDFQAHIIWVAEVKSCVIPHKPMSFIGVWAGMVTFDIFVLVMVFINAVNKPYRENSEIVRNLQRDGIKFFATLLFLRIINLFLTIFIPSEGILVIIFFLWAIASITLSRFLLMVKATNQSALKGEPPTPTNTTSWRNDSGHWSRKSDVLELKAIS